MHRELGIKLVGRWAWLHILDVDVNYRRSIIYY